MMIKAFKYSVIFFGFALLLWVGGFLTFLTTALLAKTQTPDQTDAIVVFTGDYQRIDKALELFSQNISQHLFITGVNPAVPLIDILERSPAPLPPCCIDYDSNATNTIENAWETQNWAMQNIPSISNIILVTSDYHMHRAAQETAFALPHVNIYRYPVTIKNTWSINTIWSPWFLEYHKFLYRAIIGRL